MLLNVLKGAYPSLQQISKDHLIAFDEKLERGACLVESTDENGITTWKIAGADDATDASKIVHFSLHGYNDYQTIMAGVVGSHAKVSALSCLQTMEIETDMFTETVDGELKPGDFLTVGANGRLVKRTSDAQNAYAQVIQGNHDRWANNAPTFPGPEFRQGNTVAVITARTVFIPGASADSSD